jgi:hypothetical protein
MKRRIILHHNNASPYIAHLTSKRTEKIWLRSASPSSVWSDLIPSDYHTFHPLTILLQYLTEVKQAPLLYNVIFIFTLCQEITFFCCIIQLHSPHTFTLKLYYFRKIVRKWYAVKGLKDHMKDQYYEKNEAVQQTICTWLWNTETDFCHSSIFKLLQCWQKYLNHGDLMEYWQDISSDSKTVPVFVHMSFFHDFQLWPIYFIYDTNSSM